MLIFAVPNLPIMKNKQAPRSIFLVDDDCDEQMLFSDAFASVLPKEKLRTFDSAIALLDCLKNAETLPCILFLDLNMPLMDGIECLQEIRRDPRYEKLFVVIYSTSVWEKDRDETFKNGANVYVAKPTDLFRLQTIIKKVLDLFQQSEKITKKENFFVKA